MSEPTADDPTSPQSSADRAARPRRNAFWLVPAATFLVGLLLGGVLVAVTGSGDDASAGPEASSGPTASPTTSGDASPRPAATVTVPGACLEVADSTQQLLALVRDAVTAARDLDASRLSSIVRQLQEEQSGLQQQANACRSAAPSILPSP